ncbi:MAG: 4Fe-4S binding protein, partial [Deltaproteobacteria bacterium]|nr:4Fe-4S binding protein [Deltaproteobacteria bacterium]
MLSLRFWRRAIQTGTALAFIAIPVLNKLEYNSVAGNLLSLKAARLMLADPLAALQVVAGTLSLPASLCIGAGLVLLFAAVMGPVFCGWICPFGLLSELVYNLRQGKKKNYPATGKTSAKPFLGKLLLTALGLAAVFLCIPVPWLNQLSLPGWYTR